MNLAEIPFQLGKNIVAAFVDVFKWSCRTDNMDQKSNVFIILIVVVLILFFTISFFFLL